MPSKNKFAAKVQEFDAFAHAFRFRLPNGEKEYRSWKGVCFTVILIIILAFYGVMQSIKLFERDETDVMQSSRDAHFDTDFVYSENLWYAFGITAYDDVREPIDDPSYGELKAFTKTWGGIEGDDVYGVNYRELAVRNCTEAELHVNGKSDP